MREIPVVGAKADFVVFRGNAEGLSRSAINAEQEDANTDNAASDEQKSLCHIHPYNSLHTTKQRQDDNGDAQNENYAVDIDV